MQHDGIHDRWDHVDQLIMNVLNLLFYHIISIDDEAENNSCILFG